MTAIPARVRVGQQASIAAAIVVKPSESSQAFAHMAAEEPTMYPPQDKALAGARKTWRRLAGQNLLPKLICQCGQCEIQKSNRGNPATSPNCRLTQKPSQNSAIPQSRRRIISKSGRNSAAFGPLAAVAGLLTSCLDFNAMAQVVPPPYIEPGFALRFYPGYEDTRLGWVHPVSGNYGLAEQHYRRAVEATHQNG
jgi:hypothetical protein